MKNREIKRQNIHILYAILLWACHSEPFDYAQDKLREEPLRLDFGQFWIAGGGSIL